MRLRITVICSPCPPGGFLSDAWYSSNNVYPKISSMQASAPLARWANSSFRSSGSSASDTNANADWQPAVAMHPPPGAEQNITAALGPLSPAITPPIRITESFPALVLTKLGKNAPSGGQNCAPLKLAAIADECRGDGPMPPPRCNGADPVSNTVTLECKPGTGTISTIEFAEFGAIEGSCDGGFITDGCHAPETLDIVKALCIGKARCSLNATVQDAAGGDDPCPSKAKRLAVVASGCEAAVPTPPPTPPPTPGPAGPPAQWVVDFGQNVNGFVTLTLPAGHGLATGTQIRVEHGEITYADSGAAYDTYCHANWSPKLRHQPCLSHQTYGTGHNIGYSYIGDFNCANQTNIYVVGTATLRSSCSIISRALPRSMSPRTCRVTTALLGPPAYLSDADWYFAIRWHA